MPLSTKLSVKTESVFWLIVGSFYFQQFWLVSHPVPIKPYMLCVAFGGLVILLKSESQRLKVPIHIPFVAIFFVYMISTALWSSHMELAFVRTIGILSLVFTYFVLTKLVPMNTSPKLSRRASKLLYVFLIFNLLYYLAGLYKVFISGHVVGQGFEQGVFGLYMEGNFPRLRGFADSPNNMGLMLLPMFFGVYLLRLHIGWQYYVLLYTVLLLTLSMTTYLAFILPLTILMSFKSWKKFFRLTLGVLSLFISAFWMFLSLEWFRNIVEVRVFRITTGSGRYDLFAYSIDKASESPLFGFGLAQARVYLDGFEGRELQSTHNSFIESFFEGGVVGLALFLLCWGVFAFYLLRVKVNGNDKLGLFCYLLSLFIFSNANLMTYVELMVLNFFFIWFISVRLKNKSINRASSCFFVIRG